VWEPTAPGVSVDEVRREFRLLTSEVDGIDHHAALRFGVHRTDMRCLDVISARGPLTASELGRAVGLTSGGTSIALGRLEEAGFVRRRNDMSDRRRVWVEVTPLTRQREREVFGPMGQAMGKLLSRYAGEELRVIWGFLSAAREVLTAHGPGAADIEESAGG
jgi:DNA-binding MarR family transcriptional regulator